MMPERGAPLACAVMMPERGAPLAWLQRQMGHTTLQMLIQHYWRYIQTHDLVAEQMTFLEGRTASSESSSKGRG
jgi:hypothetical protein